MPKGIWKPYNEDQLKFIRDNYLDLPVKTIAKEVGGSFGRIVRTLKGMGLEIPIELVEKRKRESKFSPGHKTFNRGLKQEDYMTPEQIEKTKATRFKKGNTPHNVNYDGHERTDVDGYTLIRVRKGKYVLKHRWLWEQENGPIPEGHALSFIDGDKTNISIENLELISRAENMLRNSHYTTPETVESVVLIYKLNSKIKQLEYGKE